ncbi:MAG TPA: LysR family transcriptional regulator [Candidatus Coproplasma stercoripullorum]|uniref:LysR family transcriptional regulator n=1 Tax=Candidatus Coproplasma stercoripullorum TaxID=2840751 RepID=A0A9D1DAA7_9FIRM|nr:LysR family transcriptional regulator [Candidatus Coproplasma stercoripullorum]
MELRELKYFLAVANEGSISGAAEALFITQPSLSRQMQNLEREVGGALFDRGNRKITLTERGKLLKKRAEEMLELYGKTVSEVSAPEQSVSGEVYIGGGESPAVKSVIRAALKVQREYPEVKFRFFSGDAPSVIERLDKGLLDFGIVLDAENISEYRTMRLPQADRWGAIMRRDCPLAEREFVTPDDLKGRPLICSDQSFAKGLISRWMCGGEIDVVATYNLLYVGSQLAEEGAGIAISLDGIINTENTGLVFKKLEPPLETHADVIWKRYAVFSKPAALFLAALKEERK